MSIASEIQRINNNIFNAYTACERQGAVMPEARNSAHLSETIDSIGSKEPKYLNFIDCDGAVLYSYTEAEAQGLTTLPPLPVREGYIYQSWNWTPEDILSYRYPLTVGAVRVPADGMTHLTFRLLPEEDLTLSIPFAVNAGSEITIDWGDGSSGVYTSSPASHTYALSGEYVVRADSEDGFILKRITGYTSVRLIKAEFGARSQIADNVFNSCYALRTVSIPDTVVSVGATAFYDCDSLDSVTIPRGCTVIGAAAFSQCKTLRRASLPKSVFCGEGCFQDCVNLSTVIIPDNAASKAQNRLFFGCRSLRSASIPSWIGTIGDQTFYNSVNLRFIDLSALTSVPVLEDANAFYAIGSRCVFYVRNAQMKQAFEAATNWCKFTGGFYIGGKFGEV